MNQLIPPEFQSVTYGAIASILISLVSSVWFRLQSLGLTIAFLVGFYSITDGNLRAFPPSEGWRWIFWVGIIAAWGATCDLLIGNRRKLQLIHWIPIVFLAIVLLANKRLSKWSELESVGWVVGIATYSLLLAWISDWTNQRVSSRAMLMGWGMSFGAASAFLVLIGRFQNYSNLAIVVGAGVGVLFLISMIFKNYRPGFSVWMVLSLFFVCLVIGTSEPWLAYLPTGMAIVILLAPLASLAAIPVRKKWLLSLLVVAFVTSLFLVWPGIEAYQDYMELREAGFAP